MSPVLPARIVPDAGDVQATAAPAGVDPIPIEHLLGLERGSVCRRVAVGLGPVVSKPFADRSAIPTAPARIDGVCDGVAVLVQNDVGILVVVDAAVAEGDPIDRRGYIVGIVVTVQAVAVRAIAFQIWARTLARYASFHPARLILTRREPLDGSLRMRLRAM